MQVKGINAIQQSNANRIPFSPGEKVAVRPDAGALLVGVAGVAAPISGLPLTPGPAPGRGEGGNAGRPQLGARGLRSLAIAACLLVAPAIAQDQPPPLKAAASSAAADPVAPTTASLRGKVVWQADALKKRFGIETDAAAAHDSVAIETTAGELFPLVRDARGRGFWLDSRLRDRELELFVRRYPGSPVVQIIRVYTLRPEGRFELDYWCDICAIPMYELKQCECCQGATRLRERRVPPGGETGVDGDEPDDPIPPLKQDEAATPTPPPG